MTSGRSLRRAVRALRTLGALALGMGLLAGGARAGAGTQPCREPGFPQEVRCGSVSRPLDPARPDGPHIDVHYVVAPAVSRQRLPDPVLLLAGGPGQSAISVAGQVMPLFMRLNHRRDIVFIDQRGTGRSAPLICDAPALPSLAESGDRAQQLRELEACRLRLQALPQGDLRQYTTPIAMADFDAVREALAVPGWNLVGISYGTRAAIEYQRQFPQRVRRLVLDGVAPPGRALPAHASADAQRVLDAMFDACAADAACRTRFPDLRGDWHRVLDGLPRELELLNPLSGRAERFRLDRPGLLQALRGPLYGPAVAAALPQALHDAAKGRELGLIGLASLAAPRGEASLAAGQHLSVMCAEDLPPSLARPVPPGRDFGDVLLRSYVDACRDWPVGTVPAAYYRVGPSASPALLMAGTLDPVTPPAAAEATARAMGAQARLVIVPNAGHGVLSLGCMADVLTNFVNARDDTAAAQVDTACADALPRPPTFVPLGRAGGPR